MAIELAPNAVEFDAFGGRWRCRLDSYACERAEVTAPGNPLEVPSRDEKVAVSRRGHDLWARSLADGREWALTTDGEPGYRYGSGPDSTSNGTLRRKFGMPHLPPAVAWSPDSTKVLAHQTDEHRLPGVCPQAQLGLPGARADGRPATRLPSHPPTAPPPSPSTRRCSARCSPERETCRAGRRAGPVSWAARARSDCPQDR